MMNVLGQNQMPHAQVYIELSDSDDEIEGQNLPGEVLARPRHGIPIEIIDDDSQSVESPNLKGKNAQRADEFRREGISDFQNDLNIFNFPKNSIKQDNDNLPQDVKEHRVELVGRSRPQQELNGMYGFDADNLNLNDFEPLPLPDPHDDPFADLEADFRDVETSYFMNEQRRVNAQVKLPVTQRMQQSVPLIIEDDDDVDRGDVTQKDTKVGGKYNAIAAVIGLFPDICPDFVATLYDELIHGGDAQVFIDGVLNRMEKDKTYPKRKKKESLKRKHEPDEEEQLSKKFEYAGRIGHVMGPTYICTVSV